ncbi:MAG: hotdog domain-containing protein [Streptosporangiaceae bacterium]
MDVTAATPPGSARGALDAAGLAAEGRGSGDAEVAGRGSGAMGFSGLGSAGLTSPELASVVASFPGMIDTLRVLQNRITCSVPSEQLAAEVSRMLTDLAIQLGPYAVDEQEQIAGRMDLPGRGQAMVPVIYLDEQDDQHAIGRVTFGRFYLGGNGAAHGGAIPLVFDDVMGRLANTGGRLPSRTAYLHVNYRSIAPIERELQLTARFDREEGRKRFLSGELRDGSTLCADVEGLFVALRPGQP